MDIFIMSESDIEQVKQIENVCQISSWSLLDYQDEIGRKDGLAFVVKKQNQVVGFILARLITTTITTLAKISSKNLKTETEIEIYNLAVEPDFQNQGAGQKLLNQVINYTKNLSSRSIWLEVRESNTKAINFYRKNGFTQIFKRRNYYSSPNEDGIIMNKFIRDFKKPNLIH